MVLRPFVADNVGEQPLLPIPPRLLAMMDTVSRLLSYVMPSPPVQTVPRVRAYGIGGTDTVDMKDLPIYVGFPMDDGRGGRAGVASIQQWSRINQDPFHYPRGYFLLDVDDYPAFVSMIV